MFKMTTFEILSALIALVGLVFIAQPVLSSLRKRRRKNSEQQKADINVELIRLPKGYCFQVSNVGKAPARKVNVQFESDKPGEDPLVVGEAERKLPCPILQPNQPFTLIAGFDTESSLLWKTEATWLNADGTQGRKELHISFPP